MKTILFGLSIMLPAISLAQDTLFLKMEPNRGHLIQSIRYEADYAVVVSPTGKESKVAKEDIYRIGN